MPYLNPDGSYANYVGSSPDQLDPTKPVQGVVAPYQSLIEGQNGAPPPSGPGAVQNGDYQGWFKNLLSTIGNPASSYDVITQLQPQLEAQGIKVNTNLEGQPSKLILPNGHYISVVDANGAWRWQDQGAAGGAPGAGSVAQPGPFQAPSMLNLGGPAGISYVPPTPTFTGANAPPTFTAPSVGEALNDSGYQFRTQQGDQSLQDWAAARGTLNDSSTAKALEDYGQNAASQEYQQVFNRDWNVYAGSTLPNWQSTVLNPTLAAYGVQAQAGANQNATNYQNAYQDYLNNWANYHWQGNFAAQNA